MRMKRKLVILGVLALLLGGTLWWFGSAGKVANPTLQPRQIRYAFTLKNNSGTVIPKAELWLFIPLASASMQQGGELKSSHEYELLTDKLGQRIAHFSFTDFPPYGTKVISIAATVQVAEEPLSAVLEKTQWLAPQSLLESDHPLIVQQAELLQKSDDLSTAKAIYEFVAGYINYSGYSGREKSALTAFKDKRGDCTEYASLFVALCRASDIPARYLGGYVVYKNQVVKATDYHNWAEFYVDGQWLIADPQDKKFGEEAKGYVGMEFITGNKEQNEMRGRHRFRVAGSGLKVSMVH